MTADAKVETAQILNDEGQPVGEPEVLTVLGLLEEMKKANRPFESAHYPVAVNNERFIHGKQIVGRREEDAATVDESLAWPSWLPPITRNMMRNLSLTKRAQMIKDTPTTKAWPNESGPNDPAAAEVANQVLGYYRHKLDWPNMLSLASDACEAHGAVGFRTVYDPDAGPRNVDGTALGDVVREMVTVFDFGMSAPRIEDSEWVFFRRWYTPARARGMLLQAGIQTAPDTSEREGPWADAESECVEAYELWYLPTEHRVPGGLHAVVIGGQVVMHEPFPYDHAELPLSVWYCHEKMGWPYGDTHVTDACPVQANINRLEAAKTAVLARTAQWMKLLVPKSMLGDFNGGQQIIGFNPDEDVSKIKVLTVDNAPTSSLDAQIGKEEQKLLDIYGLNEAVVGSDASATKNARHLAYIAELDAQKNAISRRSLNSALIRMDRQLLGLLQQHIVDARMIRIVGPQGIPALAAFKGADLHGLDVILEPAPGTDQTRTAQAKEAEELAAAGFLDPAAATERRATGLPSTIDEGMAQREVLDQARAVLAGEMVEPDPRIPPAVAENVILLVLEQAGDMDPTGLLALLDGYRALAAQQAQAQQATVKATGEKPSADALPTTAPEQP